MTPPNTTDISTDWRPIGEDHYSRTWRKHRAYPVRDLTVFCAIEKSDGSPDYRFITFSYAKPGPRDIRGAEHPTDPHDLESIIRIAERLTENDTVTRFVIADFFESPPEQFERHGYHLDAAKTMDYPDMYVKDIPSD